MTTLLHFEISSKTRAPLATIAMLLTAIIVSFPTVGQAQVVSHDPNYSVSLFAHGLQLPDGGLIYRPATNDLLVTEEDIGHISSVNASTGAVSLFAVTPTSGQRLYDLNINSLGEVFAAVVYAGPVLRFDSGGAFFGSFPIPTLGYSVAFDSQDNFYLASGPTILRFAKGSFSSPTVFADGFGSLQGIRFNAAGELIATDATAGRVYLVTPGGLTSSSHTVLASGFGSPYSIAIEPHTQDVFVLDGNTGAVSRITSPGVVSTFATGFSLSSSGLGFDTAGNLYVDDKFVGAIWKFTPKIVSTTLQVQPDHGGNAGTVTVNVTGSGFQNGATVKLTGLGGDVIGSNVTVANGSSIRAAFDLSGAPPGPRNVVVTNPDKSSPALPGGFAIEEGGAPAIRVLKIGGPAVPGRDVIYYIVVSNVGNVDSGILPIVEFVDPWFKFTSSSIAPTNIKQAPALFPTSAAGTDYNAFVEWDLPSLGAGELRYLRYTVVLDPTFPVGAATSGTACFTPEELKTAREVIEAAEAACFAVAAVSCVAGPACIEAAELCHAGAVTAILSYAAAAALCSAVNQPSRGSADPNDLIGPTGIGPERWIESGLAKQYSVLFENLPTATKAATSVAVADTFDTAVFELSKLSLGPIGFGTFVFTPSAVPIVGHPIISYLDLRPSQSLIVKVTASIDITGGVLSIHFDSIDPDTGLSPSDPTVGFLPPGQMGNVLISVTLKNAVETGTAIVDDASVTFDANAPISTPTWTNTLDNTPPVSHVLTLPVTETSTTFTVNWTGTDVGSGVQDFIIYVSDNGGPFGALLANTTATSATFTGQTGHSYAFYSLARDLVGNVEGPKAIAEAATQVVIGDTTPPVIIPNVSGTLGTNGWYISNATVSWDVSDPESGITSSSGCNLRTLIMDTAGLTLTCTATNGAGLISSVPVSIKIDKTPPTLTAAPAPAPNASGWNNSSVTVTFVAADSLSGIASVSSPVTVSTEGAAQIVSGTATDKAGNSSAVQTILNIDTTPPEAFLQFDPVTHDVVLFGRDSLSGVGRTPMAPQSIVSADQDRDDDEDNDGRDDDDRVAQLRTYRVLDLAGNTLTLVAKVRMNRHQLGVQVVSLQYGAGPLITLFRNSESFEWDVDGGRLSELEQTFKAGAGEEAPRVEADFNARRNETTVDQQEPEPRRRLVRTGLALLRLATSAGKLAIEY